jgi:hypothetical protein
MGVHYWNIYDLYIWAFNIQVRMADEDENFEVKEEEAL